MVRKINIGGKFIGYNQPVFIIAEVGVNHNGNLELAKKLIDAAAKAGADAVKFQTFKSELLVTLDAFQADYQVRNTGKKESQFAMLKRLELPRVWYPGLQNYAKLKGIIFLSAPFTEDDADFLESINIPAFKIPSGEITNIPYLRHVAKKGKPMVVSTGMANLQEVEEVVKVIRSAGNQNIVVLHCTSNYPASPDSLNLLAINTLQKKLGLPIGYSDHSVGQMAGVAAVALGAVLIEKHFTLDKNMEGPDHKASMNPQELKAMVQAVRDTTLMLGNGGKKPVAQEKSTAEVARKSVVAARDIVKGEIISAADLTARRPGTGLPPGKTYSIIGKVAKTNIIQGALIKESDYGD